jgi:DNA repair exonuclease SbcCD ATPase subunit
MAKVVTSAGFREFVASGKTEEMPKVEAKAEEKPKPDVIPEKPVQEVNGKPEANDYIDDDKETQAEIEKSERFTKTINKKHRAMKEAQEAASEAEEFARNQWNEARLAKERATALEERLKELQAQAPKKEPEVKKPVHDEVGPDGKKRFYDDQGQFKAFEYAEALATFAANEAVVKDRQRQIEETQKAAQAQAEELAKAKVAEARKVHSDYDEVIQASDVKTHQQVLNYMTGSEWIAEIAYYLAKNPEYVERINKLNPLKAIAEIGKLELTFEKPKAEIPTEVVPAIAAKVAPAPIVPLQTNSSGIVQTDPAKMDFKQLRKYEAERAAAKRRGRV